MSEDWFNIWVERAKLNTEIIEQQQTKTKKMIILKWICVLAWAITIGLLTAGTLLTKNKEDEKNRKK
jgi:hypothetical protein